METLRTVELPARGIHLHAYNGPLELIPELVALGSYFSFNAGQLRPDRPKVVERICAVPEHRLLIETDAPDFLPPAAHRAFRFDDPSVCHPGTIRCGYAAIAKVRGVSFEALASRVEANFLRYFNE